MTGNSGRSVPSVLRRRRLDLATPLTGRLLLLGLALAVFLTGRAALAQADRSLSLDGRLLPLQVDTFAVFVIQGRDTIRTGTLIDALRASGGRLTRIYSQSDRVLGPQLDTIISNVADLRPVSYVSASPTGIRHLTYSPGVVTGWSRLPDGDSAAVRVSLPPTVYDGASYDLVVRASQLADDFALTVPAFMAGPNAVGSVTGHVTATATVDGHACWVFNANFAGMPVTFWIDKSTRALRRQLMQPRVDFAVLFTRPPYRVSVSPR